ncbi:hypothetical protein BJ138DRAFT_1102651 [Hygrophoropsis aurantiaca]|uniref:Uncharacterized protein n=1 Tax=Hygrophoropsis aurantiaca TaxID=72124 RepID=A0ACB8A8S1_9AGAM|nr:hypothetical protein BJ138DRAFT_1102651 [Hygrophoropsis aurantiaca]
MEHCCGADRTWWLADVFIGGVNWLLALGVVRDRPRTPFDRHAILAVAVHYSKTPPQNQASDHEEHILGSKANRIYIWLKIMGENYGPQSTPMGIHAGAGIWHAEGPRKFGKIDDPCTTYVLPQRLRVYTHAHGRIILTRRQSQRMLSTKTAVAFLFALGMALTVTAAPSPNLNWDGPKKGFAVPNSDKSVTS